MPTYSFPATNDYMLGVDTAIGTDSSVITWNVVVANNMLGSALSGLGQGQGLAGQQQNALCGEWGNISYPPVSYQTGGNAYYQTQWIGMQNASIYIQSVNAYPANNVVMNLGNYSLTETEEQKAERAKLDLKRKEAELRAEELLLSCLTPEQEKQYKDYGYFETDINDKTYRIKKGRTGNVELREGDKAKYRYCAHPDAWTPDQDVMLSQLLTLKTDEGRFLKTANRTVLS